MIFTDFSISICSGYGLDTQYRRHRSGGPADVRSVSESFPVVGHMSVRTAQDDRLQQRPADRQLQQRQWRRLRRATTASTAATRQRSVGR